MSLLDFAAHPILFKATFAANDSVYGNYPASPNEDREKTLSNNICLQRLARCIAAGNTVSLSAAALAADEYEQLLQLVTTQVEKSNKRFIVELTADNDINFHLFTKQRFAEYEGLLLTIAHALHGENKTTLTDLPNAPTATDEGEKVLLAAMRAAMPAWAHLLDGKKTQLLVTKHVVV